MFDPNASQITITDTAILLRGAEAPAPIVDRRLDGRLLVAVPGKKNRWLVLDGADVPALLAKRIKAPSKVVEERIVCTVEDLDATVALVEAWVVGGGKESDEAAAAKKAAAAAKRAATLAAKAEAERKAKWEADAPARAAAAAARAEVERARQAQWAQERRERDLAAAAARRAEDARMATLRANRAVVEVAHAPAIGEAFEVEGDEMRRADTVMICESLGRSWKQRGIAVCYAYGRPATADETAAYRAGRPRSGHDVIRLDRAPAVGDLFKLRDGTGVVCTSVGRPYRVDESLDEDYTSFYSSELWEQDVVRVDYEYVDAPVEPEMVPQQAQQQQANAGGTVDAKATVNRSALMKSAWRVARILDGFDGGDSLYYLSDTMRTAWAIARREAEAAAAGAVEMVQQQAQQQQANASAKPVPASATGPFDALALKAGYTGTNRTITAASTIYAVHGADGIEDPLIGDLEWLRQLLRSCQNPGAFRALLGGSDDPDATLMMIMCVEDLYRRLATLVGHRPDIYDSERDLKDIE